jgi:dTDP-4-dehydrorhamnose 3,5-epimerase-like enzyme
LELINHNTQALMQKIKWLIGNRHVDERGILTFNNDFNASLVKRIYFIENKNKDIVRGWQGHKIEQRWFSAVNGSFKINIITIDNWTNPSKKLKLKSYILSSTNLEVLHVPQGNITSIQSLKDHSKLMVFSNYSMGEVNDEYHFDINYFK